MATVLEKDIIRETSVKFDNREIQVTLTEKQTVFMKLKGMKSGGLEITIEDLYKQLKGDVPDDSPKTVVTNNDGENDGEELVDKFDLSDYKGDKTFLISLHDIRHAAMINTFDMNTKIKVDGFLVELINARRAFRDKKS